MKERILIIWAATATLVALGSVGTVGYLYGKKSAQPSVQNQVLDEVRPAVATPVSRPRSETEGGASAVAAYTVPQSLVGLPNQWVSVSASKAQGFAILFQPATREIIVEQCKHHGYLLDHTGQPQTFVGDTCSQALNGSIESIQKDLANVVARDGRIVKVSFNVDRTAEPMTLELEFDDFNMTLQPGSKNDLMQAFEALPDIKQQRRAFLTALATGDRAQHDRRSPGE